MNNQKPNSRMHYGLKKVASTCRGTTLAPLVISLAIAALAGIAFLNQGAALGERKNLIKAPDEVFGYIQEWVNLRKQKGSTPINPAELSFHGKQNVFGRYVNYMHITSTTSTKAFDYPTQSPAQCDALKPIFQKYKIIQEAKCGDFACGCGNRVLHIELRYN
ncbi:MAG: hypothetical protein P8I13_06920 [Porticoccaceae bacterium]|nr:hypothetical protein [Porticoccaceae bacterium]